MYDTIASSMEEHIYIASNLWFVANITCNLVLVTQEMEMETPMVTVMETAPTVKEGRWSEWHMVTDSWESVMLGNEMPMSIFKYKILFSP